MHGWNLTRRLSLVGICVAIAAILALLSSLGLPATSLARTARGPRAVVMPNASGRLSQVVVLLRDTHAGLKAGSTDRRRSVRAEERPLVALLRSHGARDISVGKGLPYVIARVSSAQRTALVHQTHVKSVVLNRSFALPNPVTGGTAAAPTRKSHASTAQPTPTPTPTPTSPYSTCGTAQSPENDPEADSVINSTAANALGFDGAGVKTAYMAGGIDTTIEDYQRNAKYASASSPTGSPVVTNVNFNGDPDNAPDTAGNALESFIDASSIVSQGNETFDISSFTDPAAHPLPSPCDIKITGVAPGASVYGLDVFSNDYDTTTSNIVEAIDWAVANGVQVLNQSFGSDDFPTTTADAVYDADDEAVAAGVTVTVSSGDSGVTSTLGSPAIDPNVIDAGASTTFRVYEQLGIGGTNAPVTGANGTWLDNNISSLSSSGFSQPNGDTLDLVAPGDLNWVDCSADPQYLTECENDNGVPVGLQWEGGTSEAAPLTAGAAADVIGAYASTHGGSDPAPALVKQILMSTAADTDAPAEQQGAGLLNVLAAVKEAEAVDNPSAGATGSLLASPDQINVIQNPGQSTTQQVSITNSSNSPETVNLSTRAFTQQVASQSGSLCLNPTASATGSCGPPTGGTFVDELGNPKVSQTETFSVPSTGSATRLDFSAAFPDTSTADPVEVALYDPSGTYAGYSLPQGFGDYADIQVSDPAPGTWTAVFSTAQTVGASGTVQWQANTYEATSAGQIEPASLTVAPGQTSTAAFTATSPVTSGDAGQSIVLSTVGGSTTTIPVTVRTLVPTGWSGGSFSGVLTGGNGRAGSEAQTNTYQFTVPPGQRDLDVSASFADAGDGVVAYLEDPNGQTVASSSNVTLNKSASDVIGTKTVQTYKDSPAPGTWHLVLEWLQPVSGSEISEPFTGQIQFNGVQAAPLLPHGPVQLKQGKSYRFYITVRNSAQTPEAYFLDPRNSSLSAVRLDDIQGSDQGLALPLNASEGFPAYVVPPETSELETSVTSSAPVTYDLDYYSGDPDLSPEVSAPGVTSSLAADDASLNYTPGGELSTGLWAIFPSEFGPYGGAGAPAETADVGATAVTLGFDPTVSTTTGDLWSAINGITGTFTPVYLKPGQAAVLPVTITPAAAPGTHVSGEINLDDAFEEDVAEGSSDASGDELGSYNYSYTVATPPPPHHHHHHHHHRK